MINSKKRFKLFNKLMEYFNCIDFKIKYVYLYNDTILYRVYNCKFEIRKQYTIIIYDFNFTINYLRINCKQLKYKQKEISKNYKIK